ncbi:MAG: hypothetical protein ACYC61_07590 [Isosphaeraceae bacterium]
MRSPASVLRSATARVADRATRLWNALKVPVRWPRATTRRLMVLVALAALALAAEMTRRRGEAYLERSVKHLIAEGYDRGGAKSREEGAAYYVQQAMKLEAARAKGSPIDRSGPPNAQWTAEEWRKNAAWMLEEAKYERELESYHGMLRKKYEYAASYPWLPVAPDPPRPRRRR